VADGLVRTLGDDGVVRGLAAVTTGLVEDARRRHGTAPTATAALGRALTAALLLAGTLKRDERLSLEFGGDGPLGRMLVDATPEGTVRGFVARPDTHLPPRNGKLNVGGAVGRGVLCVMRVPLVGGTPYRGIVPLVSGEVGADVAHYLLESEQVPSAVAVGVFVELDGSVCAAWGYLLQALPGADPALIDGLAASVESAPSPSALVREGLDAEGILGRMLAGIETHVLERRDVAFRCRCTRERVTGAILAVGRAEIEDMLATQGRAAVVCEFCGERYLVDGAELRALLAAGD